MAGVEAARPDDLKLIDEPWLDEPLEDDIIDEELPKTSTPDESDDEDEELESLVPRLALRVRYAVN